jgi:hypothetical protein
VPSNLGGAQNGYLGLILAAPAYTAIVGADATGAPQPFIAPTFPGAVPTIVGINEAAREAELRKFEADTYAWCKYNNMCNTSYQLWTKCTSRQRKQEQLVITSVVNDGYLDENEFYESVNGSGGRNWKGKVMSPLVNFSLSSNCCFWL